MSQQILQNFNYAVPIVPSDTVALPQKNNRFPDVVWVGGAGIVQCVLGDGSVVALTITASFPFLPLTCTRINSTGTTATLLVGLWQL